MVEFRDAPNSKALFDDAARILAAREDVNAFISYCFLNERPQHAFHAEWHDFIDKNDTCVIFAPLEHGKTEQLSVWRSLWLLGRNPELRIWICSATGKLAKKIVSQCDELILTNERVQRVFPGLIPENRSEKEQMWNTEGLIIKRELNAKDPSLQATGIMGSSQGSRVDIFIGDDMMNFKNTFFDAPRERSIEWFRSADCMGRIAANGKVTLINNPWHDKALAHVAASEMHFANVTYKACDDKLENILWPTEESVGRIVGFNRDRLENKRRIMGTVEFSRCYLGQAISDSTEWFNISVMSRNVRPDLKPHTKIPSNMIPICGVDPAVSKKRTSAESCFFVGGVDPKTNRKQVKSILIGRWSAKELTKIMLLVYRGEPDIRFMVEGNAQQDYLLQILQTREILEAVGATPQEATHLPKIVRPFITTERKRDPDVGIASMHADFEAQTWDVPECFEVEKWFRQALDYKPGRHTGDVLMASYFFWDEANRMSTRRATVDPTVVQKLKELAPDAEFSGLYEQVF